MVRVKIPSATGSPARQADLAYTASEVVMKGAGVANDAGTDFGQDQDWVPLGLTKKGTIRQTGRPEPLAIVTGNGTAIGQIGSTVEGGKSFALQMTGTWVGGVTVEESNDNANWVAVALWDSDHSLFASGGNIFSQLTSNDLVYGIIRARYARVRVAAYTSGTIVITCVFWGEYPPVTAVRALIGSATTTSPNKLEDAAHASGDQGTFALGVRNDNGATAFTSTNGDYIPFGLDNAGVPFTAAARPTGAGLTQHKRISTADTNGVSLKASAGQIYAIHAYNAHATDKRFLKLYNKASAPTVGTDVPVKTITLGPNNDFTLAWPTGLNFATGIAYAITSWLADNDSGGIGANEVVLNIDYI